MEHATQVEQIHKLFHYIDTQTTAMSDQVYHNKVSGYTDPHQLVDEKEKLFRQYPLFMGLSCDVAQPGDYLTDDFSSDPVVIIRAQNGQLNAFLNVCRHRGSRVVEGCGSAKRAFHCPYHGWSYDQEGRLIAIPYDEGFATVDRQQRGLRRIPVVEKEGMIWIKTTPGAELDIAAHLGEMRPDLQSYALGGYHHYKTSILRRKMNWKLVADTFMESYHLNSLHKNTVGRILQTNRSSFDPFGKNFRFIIPRHDFEELRGRPEKDWDLLPYTSIIYMLFPNTIFIMQRDHVETWRIFPCGDNPAAAQMYLTFYVPEPVTSEEQKNYWEKNWALTLDTVEKEDFPLGEGIQQGFYSGAQKHIIYGNNEPALRHYHTSIKQSLGIEQVA